MKPKKIAKPKVFVGSSSERYPLAEAICHELEKDDEVSASTWKDGIFKLGQNFLESLLQASESFDFAVFVLSPDDKTISRENGFLSPRDNIVFEIGLFMGRLGKERIFIVIDKRTPVKVPTDWSGLAFASYDVEKTGSPRAIVKQACYEIREEINARWNTPQRSHQSVGSLAVLTSSIRKMDARLLQIGNAVSDAIGKKAEHIDSVYHERAKHYETEKIILAENFVNNVLKPRIEYLKRSLSKKTIRIIFDAGTTIDPIIDIIGKQAEQVKNHWCSDIPVYTNSIKGLENILRYREPPRTNYSELPIKKFYALPGRVVAPFEAIADDDTLNALDRFRDDKAYHIAVTTGNYLFFHNREFAEIARGDHHGDFKATLCDMADEIYVISPLGKLLNWHGSHSVSNKLDTLESMIEHLNRDLGFRYSAKQPDKLPYEIVSGRLVFPKSQKRSTNISNWLKKSVLVTTSRSNLCLFHEHYTALKLQIDEYPSALWRVNAGPFLCTFPFDALSISLAEQFKAEVPHKNLWKLARKYFYLPDDFQIPT